MIDQKCKLPKDIVNVLWLQIQSDGSFCYVVPDEALKYVKNKTLARSVKIPIRTKK